MPLMRTQDEIVDKVREVRERDFFGFITSDLLSYLEYEKALPFLNEGATKELWEKEVESVRITDPLAQVTDYLSFAWGKANDRRGLSSCRSIEHIHAWLWLAGYSEFIDIAFNEDAYEYYGKPQLVAASVLVGFDWKAHDDGLWSNDERIESISRESIDSIVEKFTGYAERFK